MFVDQKTERVTVPLNTALQAGGKLELANSTSPLTAFTVIPIQNEW
jgi:hypothetical protein